MPDKLPELVQASHKINAQITAAVKATAPAELIRSSIEHPDYCSPSSSAVDFRALQLVSPVKDQGECGACWAFATNAALESSYLGARKEKVSASEQELISCYSDSIEGGSCGGGWWAFGWLKKPGIESEKSYPYEHADTECKTPLSVEFRALRSDYVGDATSIPSTDDLKAALCKHGALAVGMNATPAFQQFGYDHHEPGAVFAENDNGKINHGISLVGWDDSKEDGAWLIKNSWDVTWGDQGFLWVKWGTNKIGLGAAWAEAWPKDYDPTPQARRVLDRTSDRSGRLAGNHSRKPMGPGAL